MFHKLLIRRDFHHSTTFQRGLQRIQLKRGKYSFVDVRGQNGRRTSSFIDDSIGPVFIGGSRAAVPNPRAADQYRSMGHLVPGLTERIINFRPIDSQSGQFYFDHLSVTSMYDSSLDACLDTCLGHVIRYR